MAEKTYRGDLLKFHEKLKARENFAFCKFSDGELFILQGRKFTLSPKPEHHGYQAPYDYKDIDPERDSFQRDRLFDALRYDHPDYYVGICAPNDQGHETFDWMRKESGRDEEHLTWANLFVNANYKTYRELYLPEYASRKVVMVCSQYSDLSKLGFEPVKDFRVGPNCIVNDYGLINVIKVWMLANEIKDHLFLFACSSLGNFMCHQLHAACPHNTYIDVGSTMNPDLGLSLDRGYLSAAFGEKWRGHDTSADLEREEPWG